MCSYADDEVFLHLRTGQTEPAGTRGLSYAEEKDKALKINFILFILVYL